MPFGGLRALMAASRAAMQIWRSSDSAVADQSNPTVTSSAHGGRPVHRQEFIDSGGRMRSDPHEPILEVLIRIDAMQPASVADGLRHRAQDCAAAADTLFVAKAPQARSRIEPETALAH
jgi:hypothetical protein